MSLSTPADNHPNNEPQNELYYQEHPLDGRGTYAIEHIPPNCDVLLDAGCAHGYTTVHFANYAKQTIAIDIDADAIAVAQKRYPNIAFYSGGLESIPLANSSATCIICTDVMEHVADEVTVLNEFFRVLQPGGTLIITTPHKGLFRWLDSYNVQYYLRKHGYPVYKLLFKLLRGTTPKRPEVSRADFHRHYSLRDFQTLFNASDFANKYIITDCSRRGIFFDPISYGIAHTVSFFTPVMPVFMGKICQILHKEYNLEFGSLAYNIALTVQKTAA